MQSAIQSTIRLGMLALLSTVFGAIIVARFFFALSERRTATSCLLTDRRRPF